MVTDIAANFNYNLPFLINLQTQGYQALAEVTKKENSLSKLDIGGVYDVSDSLRLSEYLDMIEQVKHCDSCFRDRWGNDEQLKEIINNTKKLITKVVYG